MARMIAEVYDALKSAGAPEEQARAAATAVAGQQDFEVRLDRIENHLDRLEDRLDRVDARVAKVESDLAVLKWMVGFTLAMNVAILFFIWQLMLRLPG
ncbi:MAG: hypothetical protein ACREH6_14830 [Geminicoccaceae bacterium]